MRFSTHYYVLSLGEATSAMYEAFRDSLIAIENHGFPVVGPARESDVAEHLQWRGLARTVDKCFGRYQAHEPLALVVVGAPEMQAAFTSVTEHGAAIVGRIEGDHSATSSRDLGQIVWPIVKESLSGVQGRAMRDLEDFATRGRVATGLESVVRAAGREVHATLLVEDDYHRRGSIREDQGVPEIVPDFDVREAIDDIVDAVIEKVLESAGHVVFTPPGSLTAQEQIVLLLKGARDS